MTRRFVDTSAWLAYVDRNEPHHAAMKRAIQANKGPLVTSSYVIDETLTHAKRRLGAEVAVRLGNELRNRPGLNVIHVNEPNEEAAWRLFCERTDKGYSFTDCTSFVLMRSLGVDSAFALDDDFRQEGFDVLPA